MLEITPHTDTSLVTIWIEAGLLHCGFTCCTVRKLEKSWEIHPWAWPKFKKSHVSESCGFMGCFPQRNLSGTANPHRIPCFLGGQDQCSLCEFSSESLSGLANASSCTWMMGQQQFGLHFFAVNLTNQNLQAHTIYSIYLVDGHQKSCEHRLE